MWSSLKFLLILSTSVLTLTFFSPSYIYFAVYSELVWLGIYSLSSLTGVYLDDVFLLTTPFFILLMTAVEATVIWSIILCKYNY